MSSLVNLKVSPIKSCGACPSRPSQGERLASQAIKSDSCWMTGASLGLPACPIESSTGLGCFRSPRQHDRICFLAAQPRTARALVRCAGQAQCGRLDCPLKWFWPAIDGASVVVKRIMEAGLWRARSALDLRSLLKDLVGPPCARLNIGSRNVKLVAKIQVAFQTVVVASAAHDNSPEMSSCSMVRTRVGPAPCQCGP